jgi:hypothetical protein
MDIEKDKIKTEEKVFRDERFNKLHLLVCIVAAATVTAVCLIRGESIFTMALLASLAIIIFYVAGNLVRYYLVTRIFPPPPPEEEPGDEFADDTLSDNPDEAANETSAGSNVPNNRAHDYMSRE